jgi:hypothetical protein
MGCIERALVGSTALGVCLLYDSWAVASITLTAVELVVSSTYGGGLGRQKQVDSLGLQV